MSQTSRCAKLELNGRVYELPVVTGTESETGIDIAKLRAQTGAITLDEGYEAKLSKDHSTG